MYDITLRNAAGRETRTVERASTGNRAADAAVRRAKKATGETWYVVRCDPRG